MRNSSVEGDFGRRETSKKADTEAGDHLSVGVAEVPSLLCFCPSCPTAGRPLLLYGCPVCTTVAGAPLLLSAQGKQQRRQRDGWEGRLPPHTWGWSAYLLCPKAVLACINISSMRQMFFQMRELPQLWHISRVDFVRNGSIALRCPLPPS